MYFATVNSEDKKKNNPEKLGLSRSFGSDKAILLLFICNGKDSA